MQRILVLNPKGGAGKTTIATNVAAALAASGERPALMDLDPQGSSIRWLRRRPEDVPHIHGIAGYEHPSSVTRSWQMRIPSECRAVVIDTPAAITPHALPEFTRGVDAVLVPVMPSEIDIHATAKCIADLLLVAKIRRTENRIGIIANRVRSNTRVFQSLMKFLESLDIPLVATLRDTQNYLRSAELGRGVYEMPRWQVMQDYGHWQQIIGWLGTRRPSSGQRPVPKSVPAETESSRFPAAGFAPRAEVAPALEALP